MIVLSIIGYILLGLLALILLLLFTPLRVCTSYLEDWRLTVYLFGVIPIYRYRPSERQPEKKPEPVAKQDKKSQKQKKKKRSFGEEIKDLYEQEGVAGVLAFFKKLAALATKAARRVLRGITVRKLELCVRIGCEDADDTAIYYGYVCTALFPALEIVQNAVRIKKQQVLVQPDFLAQKSSVKMRMTAWVWPFEMVWAGLCLLLSFVMTRQTATPVISKEKTTVNTNQ